MKVASLYDDAIEAGLDRREASFVAAARDIATFSRELRQEQSEFLAEIGLSWEEARALDEQGRASLNEQWSAYKANSAR
jgi:hypothetical protein